MNRVYWAATALGLACIACSGGDNKTEVPDSTAVQPSVRPESAQVYNLAPPPTATATPPRFTATLFPNPVTILAADSAAGQRVYRRIASCIACHGTRGEGVAGLGSQLADGEWKSGDGSLSFLYQIIRDGYTDPSGTAAPMPGVSGQITAAELFELAAYVYAVSHPGATVADTTALAADAPPVARIPPDTLQR